MSLKNGTYQLRFVPAGGEPAPRELAATGEAIGEPIRILPNIPPLFEQQHWKVTNLHDDSYFIEWALSRGPPVFFSLGGPIRPEAPVCLLPNRQEWVISKGEGENVYRLSPASHMVGVNWAVDRSDEDQAILRPYPIGVPIPQWVFARVRD